MLIETPDTLSRDALIAEASEQAKHIARLGHYKRLAYSILAISAILLLWSEPALPIKIVSGILCLFLVPLSVILYLVIQRGKKNVEALLEKAEVDLDELLAVKGRK